MHIDSNGELQCWGGVGAIMRTEGEKWRDLGSADLLRIINILWCEGGEGQTSLEDKICKNNRELD